MRVTYTDLLIWYDEVWHQFIQYIIIDTRIYRNKYIQRKRVYMKQIREKSLHE